MSAPEGGELGRLLDEQLAYYRALAPDYLHQGLDLPGGDEVIQALDAFRPTGRVLELACGPGVWTGHLLRHASEVTAVDTSPEMLRILLVRRWLTAWTSGSVFFADDAYRTPDELLEGPSSSTIRRQLPDGTAYRLVKVPHRPADLQRQLRHLGWQITVTSTAGPFSWGAGRRATHPG